MNERAVFRGTIMSVGNSSLLLINTLSSQLAAACSARRSVKGHWLTTTTAVVAASFIDGRPGRLASLGSFTTLRDQK